MKYQGQVEVTMTDTLTGPGSRELLLVAETVAREKAIEKDQIIREDYKNNLNILY